MKYLMIIVLLAACGATPKPLTVEKVVTVTVKEKCATNPPPTLVPVPAPEICGNKLCYDVISASNLASNLELLLEWMKVTWALCGQDSASQPTHD